MSRATRTRCRTLHAKSALVLLLTYNCYHPQQVLPVYFDGTASVYGLCVATTPSTPLQGGDFYLVPSVKLTITDAPPALPPRPPSPPPASPPPPSLPPVPLPPLLALPTPPRPSPPSSPSAPPPSPPSLPPPSPPPPHGCTWSRALNFKSLAVMDSGGCIIGGCARRESPGYEPWATYDDGSCPVSLPGCMDSTASNHRPAANEPGICLHVGCQDSSASNFAPAASLPGVCVEAVRGCTDPTADNFYPDANVAEPASCHHLGCTDSAHPGYDPSATADSGGCGLLLPGCTDSSALNFEAAYTVNDGSCSRPGCIDPSSAAHDAAATFHVPCLCSGACSLNRRRLQQAASGCLDPAASNYSPDATGFECSYAMRGCTDPLDAAFVAAAMEDDGSCVGPAVVGCMLAQGTLNFRPLATVAASCVFVRFGCIDSMHSNYVPSANTDDGSCVHVTYVYGCADPDALNFDSIATVSVACVSRILGCMDPVAVNFAPDANTVAKCEYLRLGCMAEMATNFDSAATQDDSSCVVADPPPSPPPPLMPPTPPPSPVPPLQSPLPPFLPPPSPYLSPPSSPPPPGPPKHSCNLLVDAVLLLDKSGSIQGHELGIVSLALYAIDVFALGNFTANVGVIAFDSRSKTLVPMTDDIDLLHNSVKNIVGGGANACATSLSHCYWHTCHATAS